jgi:small subunit ribosomal protein S35
MASAAKSACRTAARQLRTPQYTHVNSLTRPFSSTRRTLADTDKKDASSASTASYFNQTFYKRLSNDDQAAYVGLSPADREKMEKVDAALRDEFANDSRTHRELEDQISAELEHLEMAFPPAPVDRARKNDQGFFQMGEKEDIGPDEDDFQGDDISSLGHAELEQTREIREYARLAGWEMPLLASTFEHSSSCLLSKVLTATPSQISQNPSHHPQQPHPSVSATQPTWVNNTPPNEKSSSNSTLETSLSTPPTPKT